ncbi:MAG: hypothetical protein ACXABY_32720, partial [Candidatus Thorarchaeota archaeon]
MAYFYLDPRGQMTTAPPGRQRQPGGGFGAQSQMRSQVQQQPFEMPDLQKLTQKYLEGQPDVSPEKLTEGMLGRFRSEMRPAMEQGILGAQTHAARTGQSYADTAGRALGQTIAGMAPELGDVAREGTAMGVTAQQNQQRMAQEMARL